MMIFLLFQLLIILHILSGTNKYIIYVFEMRITKYRGGLKKQYSVISN